MKKIFSLIIALTLLVSIFAVSAVAFAENRTITVSATGNEYLMNKVGNQDQISDSADFKGWLTTTADVTSVFTGIDFVMEGDENYDADAQYDVVRLEYCTGNPRYEDNWKDDEKTLIVGKGGTSFNLKLSGWVAFRYSVTYTPAANADDVKVTTDTFIVYVVDTTAPQVEIGTTLSDKALTGLTVGTSFTVSTTSGYIKVTDSSSYTTSYSIQKLINGEYVEVYNNVDGLSEDYEGKDIASGAIKPEASDVMDKATYKIVYSVTDANGYKSEDLAVLLKVNAKDEDVIQAKKVNVWKVICLCIAGLCVVGIVVVIVIKPKKEENTRIVYTEDTNNTNQQ